MSVILKNKNGNEVYIAEYVDLETNKIRKTQYSIKKHGKYAKYLAEYSALNNGERLHNWFLKLDDTTIMYIYDNNLDKYYNILIDTEDYDRVKQHAWTLKKQIIVNIFANIINMIIMLFYCLNLF